MIEHGDPRYPTDLNERWSRVFGTNPLTIIGVVHLEALPGSPDWAGDIEHVVDVALKDVHALEEMGADALMLENFNDYPFEKERVDPAAIAAMAVVGREVYRASKLPLGYKMLKNDIIGSLALSSAGHGRFTRASHLNDAMVTDVGIVEATAPQATRYRRYLGIDTLLIGDIYCKHGEPIARRPIDVVALDLITGLRADALVMDGPNSALPPSAADIESARTAVPGTPLVIGSGTPASLTNLMRYVRGVVIPSPREYTDLRFWSAEPLSTDTPMSAAQRWIDAARAANELASAVG
jgi:membrane complex biogenesis BtpA family protein